MSLNQNIYITTRLFRDNGNRVQILINVIVRKKLSIASKLSWSNFISNLRKKKVLLNYRALRECPEKFVLDFGIVSLKF